MDTEVLKAISVCQQCHWWADYRGKCIKPDNVDCPQGVLPPQQEVAEMDYLILG